MAIFRHRSMITIEHIGRIPAFDGIEHHGRFDRPNGDNLLRLTRSLFLPADGRILTGSATPAKARQKPAWHRRPALAVKGSQHLGELPGMVESSGRTAAVE
jgi:hypothetical protein